MQGEANTCGWHASLVQVGSCLHQLRSCRPPAKIRPKIPCSALFDPAACLAKAVKSWHTTAGNAPCDINGIELQLLTQRPLCMHLVQ